MNRPVGLRHSTRGCSASPNILSGVLSRTTFAQPLPSCVLLTAQFSRKSAASIAWAVFVSDSAIAFLLLLLLLLEHGKVKRARRSFAGSRMVGCRPEHGMGVQVLLSDQVSAAL